MGLDELARNRQAESRAARLARPRAVRPVEAIEDVRQVIGGDAAPGIDHVDDGVRTIHRGANRDDAVVRGVRDGVDQKIPEHLLETIRIAPGVRVPAERVRSGRVVFPPGCTVSGKAFAEATNAHSLESFSDPIWFEYRP